MVDSAFSSSRSVTITGMDRPKKTAMATANMCEHSSFASKGNGMRTRFGICQKKARFASLPDALLASSGAPFALRPYRCALCRHYHLTSRTKGMFVGHKSDKAAP